MLSANQSVIVKKKMRKRKKNVGRATMLTVSVVRATHSSTYIATEMDEMLVGPVNVFMCFFFTSE